MPNSQLHILVFDVNPLRASIIEEGLLETGGLEVTVLTDANGLVEKVVALDPDVIFIDLENPNRDQLEHMLQVSRAVRRPVALFVDRSDTASVEAAIEAGVSAYIVDGLRKERVKPILDMAISRFNAFDRLRRELEETKSELAERKQIERAKSLLIKNRGLSEPEAYALLRQTAMNQNRRIADVAENLLTAAALLDKGDGR